MIHTARSFIAAALIVCIAGLGVPLPARAGIVQTEAALQSESRNRIAAFLDREDVRSALQARGVAPEEAKARVAAMTDAEAVLLAERIDELPAGGVLGVILLLFLILLITDILGFTKIFPFTRPIKR